MIQTAPPPRFPTLSSTAPTETCPQLIRLRLCLIWKAAKFCLRNWDLNWLLSFRGNTDFKVSQKISIISRFFECQDSGILPLYSSQTLQGLSKFSWKTPDCQHQHQHQHQHLLLCSSAHLAKIPILQKLTHLWSLLLRLISRNLSLLSNQFKGEDSSPFVNRLCRKSQICFPIHPEINSNPLGWNWNLLERTAAANLLWLRAEIYHKIAKLLSLSRDNYWTCFT